MSYRRPERVRFYSHFNLTERKKEGRKEGRKERKERKKEKKRRMKTDYKMDGFAEVKRE